MEELRQVLGASLQLQPEQQRQFFTRSLPNYDNTFEPCLRSRTGTQKFDHHCLRGGEQHHIISFLDRGPVLPASTWHWLRQQFPTFFDCVITDWPHEWAIVTWHVVPNPYFGPRDSRHTLIHLPTQQTLFVTDSQEVNCSWACRDTVAQGMSIKNLATHRYNNCLPCLVTRQNDALTEYTGPPAKLSDTNCGFSRRGVPLVYQEPTLHYFLLYGPLSKQVLNSWLERELPIDVFAGLLYLVPLILEFCYGQAAAVPNCSKEAMQDWLQNVRLPPFENW